MANGGFNQAFTIDLYAGEVSAKLIISQQAQFTAVECGFTLTGPEGVIIVIITKVAQIIWACVVSIV